MNGSIIFMLLMAFTVGGATQAKPAVRGCADHWAVELDRESFANNGAGRSFTAAELTRFRSRISTALKAAVADSCAHAKVSRQRAAAVRHVRVLSASGATEPHLYAAGRDRLNFEWVFAEEKLGVPDRKSIGEGLACWVNPNEKACAAEGD